MLNKNKETNAAVGASAKTIEPFKKKELLKKTKKKTTNRKKNLLFIMYNIYLYLYMYFNCICAILKRFLLVAKLIPPICSEFRIRNSFTIYTTEMGLQISLKHNKTNLGALFFFVLS